ncbi:MAG: hypothetical protein HOP12_08500 [Candidatus Eisenbacteria bacterium]|uniref:DUF5683 domain-containing protein n=1 Tax=Eiseniibacteriota bacterium TaxID=2212470 RepID=A0A849SFQ7_UNCEI|nr:hypothetical protein [Candidatus Eisenbacteria bacterium]
MMPRGFELRTLAACLLGICVLGVCVLASGVRCAAASHPAPASIAFESDPPCAALAARIEGEQAARCAVLAREWESGSAFAALRVAPGEPGVLAQRTITREWPAVDDPEVAAARLADTRSEISALTLSALLPGSGQLYVGERSGIVFAVAEVAGWIGFALFRGDAKELRSESEQLAGTPADSASAWSFDRWSSSTGQDPAALRALYQGDPEAFWDALAADASLAVGWSDPDARDEYASMRLRANDKQHDANRVGALLWINHLVSAADALRAARLHNIPITATLGLKVGGRLSNGQPVLRAQLVRRF